MELLAPAGSYNALKAAIDEGADAVYLGLKNDTNARHFAGLNFTQKQLDLGIDYAHTHNRKVHMALNTFAHPSRSQVWFDSIKQAVDLGADVLIAANIAVLDYAATHFPNLELHLSVQGSATNASAINFFKQFNIKRVVLPRVLSFKQVQNLKADTDVDIEVFAYGSLCIMAEGRCYLSSYMTGESPNTAGACSPAKYVRWNETEEGLESRLNGVLIDRFSDDEKAGYPTLCKGRFDVDSTRYHALEEPTSLNTLDLLPDLYKLGISSLKIEGRQRSPAYTRDVTRVWRQAIDEVQKNKGNFSAHESWKETLANLSEGSQTTLGAYERNWQ
ncbi:peptidase U32 family protein [Bermanella sp. R86510]|uniref:ubiquinone anaerobic biosynthesis protein UbiU n=1 Tax=unclassified Bermanella TaxID=2627862 RepID=UPI0037C5BFF7